jgi:hypothetical protein
VRAWPVVQLRFGIALTSTEYVTRRAWEQATLERCPLHPAGGCGLERLGTYERVEPPGARVARWYCRQGHTTFSLLPDCLASRLGGTLPEVEQVVVYAEASRSLEAAAARLRPDITLPAAKRWVERRLRPVRAVVLAFITMFPQLAIAAPRVTVLQGRWSTTAALARLRAEVGDHLGKLAPPVGLGPRAGRRVRRHRRPQQQTGPDPPRESR